jgi:hypothetical protein
VTVPEIRRIDPDAEAARLAEERKQRTATRQHILCHAVVQVPPDIDVPDASRLGIEILVTSSLPHPVTADLPDRVREAVWDSMHLAGMNVAGTAS